MPLWLNTTLVIIFQGRGQNKCRWTVLDSTVYVYGWVLYGFYSINSVRLLCRLLLYLLGGMFDFLTCWSFSRCCHCCSCVWKCCWSAQDNSERPTIFLNRFAVPGPKPAEWLLVAIIARLTSFLSTSFLFCFQFFFIFSAHLFFSKILSSESLQVLFVYISITNNSNIKAIWWDNRRSSNSCKLTPYHT